MKNIKLKKQLKKQKLNLNLFDEKFYNVKRLESETQDQYRNRQKDNYHLFKMYRRIGPQKMNETAEKLKAMFAKMQENIKEMRANKTGSLAETGTFPTSSLKLDENV